MMDEIGTKTLAATVATILLATSLAGAGILTNWFGASETVEYGRVVMPVSAAGGFGENTLIYEVEFQADQSPVFTLWQDGDATPYEEQVASGENFDDIIVRIQVDDQYANSTAEAEANTQLINLKIENQTSVIYENDDPSAWAEFGSTSGSGLYSVDYSIFDGDFPDPVVINEGENITVSFTYEIYA